MAVSISFYCPEDIKIIEIFYVRNKAGEAFMFNLDWYCLSQPIKANA